MVEFPENSRRSQFSFVFTGDFPQYLSLYKRTRRSCTQQELPAGQSSEQSHLTRLNRISGKILAGWGSLIVVSLGEQTDDMNTSVDQGDGAKQGFLNPNLRMLGSSQLRQATPGLLRTRESLLEHTVENCPNQSVRRWLMEKAESGAFQQLADMFYFLKKHIDNEEKKNHSNNVDIIFMAHGAITGEMMPASCLLPLPAITNVLLYSPWNCLMSTEVAYAIATGCMTPQHRVFRLIVDKDNCGPVDRKYCPKMLPGHWNSMKDAGDQLVPTIVLTPLKSPDDGCWKRFDFLLNKYGRPQRDRLIIPYIVPGHASTPVPFFVVMLALSLVLHFSRFQATVHLASCLSGTSKTWSDKKYLRRQYACISKKCLMTCSTDIFKVK
ncbi:uncharacterized protein ACBR49_013009 [Aulostomus maculatus]